MSEWIFRARRDLGRNDWFASTVAAGPFEDLEEGWQKQFTSKT